MLTFGATNDTELLDSLFTEIFSEPFGARIGYVLYDDGVPAGAARLSVAPDVSVLQKIGVKKEYRNRRYGDFFTRSLLNAVSNVSERIEIAYADEYFEKFGFVREGSGMAIDSGRLVFPCECGGGR